MTLFLTMVLFGLYQTCQSRDHNYNYTEHFPNETGARTAQRISLGKQTKRHSTNLKSDDSWVTVTTARVIAEYWICLMEIGK